MSRVAPAARRLDRRRPGGDTFAKPPAGRWRSSRRAAGATNRTALRCTAATIAAIVAMLLLLVRSLIRTKPSERPQRVRFTVTQDNVGEIDSVYSLVEKEGIGRLCLYHLVYSGRGSYLSGIDLESAQKRVLMNKMMAKVEQWNGEGRNIEVMTVDNHADGPYIYLQLKERDPARAVEALALIINNGGNRSGIAIGCIDSFGVVHPDQFTTNHALGSIRERPFSEIWNDSRVELLDGLRKRKSLLKGRCATCRWLPVCNGNFRARAEAATGDYWQSDPGCYLLDSEIAGEVSA